MKEYTFLVSMCGGLCDGTLTYEAENEDQANEMLAEEVGRKLYEAFPTLDIEYGWELINGDEDE